MKFIDGIQPPGAIYGTILIEGGEVWYFENDKATRIRNAKIGDLIAYEIRKRYEQKQRNPS